MKTTPFLLFDGHCAEAMTFYHSCFGGKLSMMKVSDTPMKAQFPPEKQDRIVNAHLESGAVLIEATDWLHPTRMPQQGNTVAIYVVGGGFAEMKSVFDKLAEGAATEDFDALRDMPFGSYGHLTDRFGVPWFFKGEKSNS